MQGRREKKWEESVNFIDDHLPYVFNYLLSGSELEFDNKIDNMSLTFKGRSPKVRFNREFFDNLESDQLDFMLAHETMHVAMRHFFMRTVFDNEKLFDMACDIQVNDLLLSAKSGTDGLPVFYKPVVEEMDGFISGPQALGQDTTGLTLTQIYDLLEEQGEDGEGEGGADSHAWMGDGLERAMAARLQAEGEAKGGLEGIGADLGLDFSNDNDKQDAQDFGNSWDLSQGTTIELRGGAKYKLTNKWIDLLARVNPDVLNSFGMGPKPGSHFRTPSRKVAHLYPKILVPNYEAAWNDPARSNKKYCVFLAVDVSGSIPQEWREKFLAFAQSIPKNKIKVEGCLFDTSIYEVEDWNNPPRRGGGVVLALRL